MLKILKKTSFAFFIVGAFFPVSSKGADFPPPGRYQNCDKTDTFIINSSNTGSGTYQKGGIHHIYSFIPTAQDNTYATVVDDALPPQTGTKVLKNGTMTVNFKEPGIYTAKSYTDTGKEVPLMRDEDRTYIYTAPEASVSEIDLCKRTIP